jgi:hypothetical protein
MATTLHELIKALAASGYNAKPSKLRQGSISAVFFNPDGSLREGTEEEWDLAYENERLRSSLTAEEFKLFKEKGRHRRIVCNNCDFKLDFNAFTSASVLPRCCINPDQVTKYYYP